MPSSRSKVNSCCVLSAATSANLDNTRCCCYSRSSSSSKVSSVVVVVVLASSSATTSCCYSPRRRRRQSSALLCFPDSPAMGRATAPSRFDDIPRGVVEARCSTIAGVRASFFFPPSLSATGDARMIRTRTRARQLVDFGECLVDKRVLNSPFKEERTFRVYKTRRRKSWTRERHRTRARVRAVPARKYERFN